MRTSRRVSKRASPLVILRDIQCENQLETWPVFTPFLIPSRHWSKFLGCKIKFFINIRITLIWSRSLGCLVPRVSCSRHLARAVLPASWACLCRRELDASCVVDISVVCSRYGKNCCCYCCCTEHLRSQEESIVPCVTWLWSVSIGSGYCLSQGTFSGWRIQSLVTTTGLDSLKCLNIYYESALSLAVAASNWF